MNQTEWLKWLEATMTVQLRHVAAPRKDIKSYTDERDVDQGVSLSNSMNKVSFTPHIGKLLSFMSL